MRLSIVIAAVAAGLIMLAGFSAPATALGWDKRSHCNNYYYKKNGRRYYYCRGSDPYAYKYERRGYYPYYKSYYWRPAHKIRPRRRSFPLPRYYPAWGYYKRRYRHRRWHKRHHGGHRFYNW